MTQLLFFRQSFYNAILIAPCMQQLNTSSCTKQESEPNKPKVKLVYFQEILSSTTDGQPVTKRRKQTNKIPKNKQCLLPCVEKCPPPPLCA